MEKKKKDLTRKIAEEVDTFDDMLGALVELLEEKGILTYEEWEKRIKKKLLKNSGLKKFRDVEF